MHSIVDRFLEHSRIMVFGEGAKEQVFLSSADWMPRNFDRRVEVMFPVEAEDIRRRIVEEIIPTYLNDNEHARVLQPDGTYARVKVGSGPKHRSQVELLAQAASRDRLDGAKDVDIDEFDPFRHLTAADGESKREGTKRKRKKGAAK